MVKSDKRKAPPREVRLEDCFDFFGSIFFLYAILDSR